MCGSATLAMEVSITSMNVAIVTVSATAHGLCPGCQPSASMFGTLLHPDLRLDGHSRAEAIEAALILVEADADGQTLDHFHEIAGGVFRRQQTGDRACRGGQILHVAVEIHTEPVDMDACALAGAHVAKLGLAKVRRDPQVAGLCDERDLLAGSDVLAYFGGAFGDDAGHRRDNPAIGQVEHRLID